MPGRCPFLRRSIMEIDESSGDKCVDPCTWICISGISPVLANILWLKPPKEGVRERTDQRQNYTPAQLVAQEA